MKVRGNGLSWDNTFFEYSFITYQEVSMIGIKAESGLIQIRPD